MQVHAQTFRFSDWEQDLTNREHAGYRKELDNKEKDIEYWIIPAVFENEVLKGVDKQKGCKVLHRVGWLQKKDNRFQFQRFKKGRFYVLLGIVPPECDDDELQH